MVERPDRPGDEDAPEPDSPAEGETCGPESYERDGGEQDTAGTAAGSAPEHAPGEGLDDLAAMRSDDALLDALGGPNPDQAGELGDSELNALLLAWRREVDSEPIGELVDVETATATIMAAKHAPARRRRRMLIPVASAAAVLAIAFGGVSLAAKGAHPGDTLWGLTQVLYADHARSVVAAADIRADFGTAREAMAAGNIDDARSALVHAKKSIPTVQREDGRADLRATRKSLLEQLNDGGSTVPDDPSGKKDPSEPAAPPAGSSSSVPDSPVTTTSPPSDPSLPSDSLEPSDPPTTTSEGSGSHTPHHTGDSQPDGTEPEPQSDADPATPE